MTPHASSTAALGRCTRCVPSGDRPACQAARLAATRADLDWRDAAPEHERDACTVDRAAADREEPRRG